MFDVINFFTYSGVAAWAYLAWRIGRYLRALWHRLRWALHPAWRRYRWRSSLG
jgi:hypothetical protein